MSRPSQTYIKRFLPTFNKQLRKLRDNIRIKRIQKKVDEIVTEPYRNIKFGAGRYRGKREERVGDDRIFFAICEQCRKEGHQIYNLCGDCDTTPNNMITFIEIVEGHKY
mgnify:CR=1 FL=1